MTLNKAEKYPFSMVLLHWMVALLMLSTLAVGWLLDDMDGLMALHRSLGITVLLLVVVRIANKLRKHRAIPPSLNAAGSLKYFAEKTTHGLLYLVMVALPLTGWLKTNAAGHSASFFGIFDLPTLVAHRPALSHLLGPIHSLLATTFAILLALHVMAALLHGFKHGKTILRRITA
jgi:cytochrome b561